MTKASMLRRLKLEANTFDTIKKAVGYKNSVPLIALTTGNDELFDFDTEDVRINL